MPIHGDVVNVCVGEFVVTATKTPVSNRQVTQLSCSLSTSLILLTLFMTLPSSSIWGILRDCFKWCWVCVSERNAWERALIGVTGDFRYPSPAPSPYMPWHVKYSQFHNAQSLKNAKVWNFDHVPLSKWSIGLNCFPWCFAIRSLVSHLRSHLHHTLRHTYTANLLVLFWKEFQRHMFFFKGCCFSISKSQSSIWCAF